MKNLIILIVCVCLGVAASAQTYIPVDSGSSIRFTIKNFGINTTGSFAGIKGVMKYSLANPAAASFTVTVDATTINTGIAARDNHLKKEEYFDVSKRRVLQFQSRKISLSATGLLIMSGTIIIKGISKEVSFPFTAISQGNDLIFKGSFNLNRRDFKVGGNSMVLSDNVVVNLLILAKKN